MSDCPTCGREMPRTSPLRILVTGSRNWTDETVIAGALLGVWLEHDRPTDAVVVHGACPTGADMLADRVWRRQRFPVEVHPAQWNTLGRAAGLIRNQHMVDLGADVCLAFIRGDSRGATHCMTRAEVAGIPVRVWRAAA